MKQLWIKILSEVVLKILLKLVDKLNGTLTKIVMVERVICGIGDISEKIGSKHETNT